MRPTSLGGLRVVAFVGRRAGPTADQIAAHGGRPLVAPGRESGPEARQPLMNGIRALIGKEAPAAVFVGPAPVDRMQTAAARRGWVRSLRRALQDAVVAAQDASTAAALRGHDLPVHYVPDEPTLPALIDGVAERVAPSDRAP
ncbi:MAG: hypothetical protein ABEL97_15845 [Salinibacter sp.]